MKVGRAGMLPAEVLAVLRREHLRGRLNADRAREAIDDLLAWDVERVPHRRLLLTAWDHRQNLSACDALYLAVAQLNQATLLTADGPLSRVTGLGVSVHNARVS